MERLNLEGQKFGRLTALRDIGNKGRRRLWECLCECGQFTAVVATDLKIGHTKSCGCLQKETCGRSVLPIGEANSNQVFKAYKREAKKRNREFSLTKEQFKKLTSSDCFYCGVKPHNIRNGKGSNGKFIYNGIDRINNTKGYTIDNCVTCCLICNQWKKAYTQQEFLMRIKLIYENLLRGRNG